MVKKQSKKEADPQRIAWAVDELRDFAEEKWAGGDVLLPHERVDSLKEAAKLIVEFCSEDEVTKTSKLRDLLEQSVAGHEDILQTLDGISIFGITDPPWAGNRKNIADLIEQIREEI